MAKTATRSVESDTKVLDELLTMRNAQQRVVDAEQKRLDSLNRTLHELTAQQTGDVPKSLEFANMGITEATQILLAAHPDKGMDTGEIARALVARGLFSRAKHLVATVYATLTNAAVDNPRSAKPKFRRKDGLWYLHKGGRRG